jgi:hypothetical protein
MKGEINTIYLADTDDVDVLKGKDNRYHYFYKIVNELNNHYYYGIHSTDNLDDNYKGSGYRLKGAYKKYGLKKFTKYVLRFFDTRKELLQYEREIVTYELCNEHNCYNIALGGNGAESLLINVRDKNGDWVQITRDEYVNNPNDYVHHSKGRIVLNNGIIHKYVLLNDLDKYLSQGWVRGEIEHSTKNRINIKKDNKQKFIYEDDLDKYLSEGWVIGGVSRNKNTISQIKGFIWITNGHNQIRINKDDLDKYLSEGWYVGICQKTTKGYIKLTNGSENVSIDPCKTEQIKYYLDLGWTYGVSREVAKHVWINNTIKSKMILKSDIDKYLSEGWVKGRAQNDMPERKQNVAVVSKNGKAIQINKDDLDKYLSEGWLRGNCNINPITNNGKTVVNKDGINKFVKLDDLDKYLSEGWVRGKINKKSSKN